MHILVEAPVANVLVAPNPAEEWFRGVTWLWNVGSIQHNLSGDRLYLK